MLNRYLEEKLSNAIGRLPSIQGFYWINNVNEQEFLQALYFQPPTQAQQQQQPPIQAVLKVAYNDNLLEFLRYNRNVWEHAQDKYKRRLHDDIKDEKLNLYLSGFLAILHDILTYENIFVGPLPIMN